MKRVWVRSVHDTFDYVMQHYYPAGLEKMVERKDTYAIISIQDAHTGGFGVQFAENQFCKGVLTLYFDDIMKEVEGAFVVKMLGADNTKYFTNGSPNQYVYDVLERVWVRTCLQEDLKV